jgi:GNAT superfamily N-acetyltransferase
VELTPDQWHKIGDIYRKSDKEYKGITSNWGIYLDRFSASVFGVETNEGIISVNATYFSKRPKKNGWGRYINCYLAYTAPEHRRKGFATGLQRWIEQQAREKGYHRVKSLVGSYAGFRFHQSLGHSFWGVNDRNEIYVDAPIRKDWEFPTTVPQEGRGVPNPHLLTQEDLVEILQKKPHNQTAAVLTEGFAKRPLKFRWDVE